MGVRQGVQVAWSDGGEDAIGDSVAAAVCRPCEWTKSVLGVVVSAILIFGWSSVCSQLL